MNNENNISFAIKYDSNLKGMTGRLFKIIENRGNIFITSFGAERIHKIFPIDLTEEAKEYLFNLPENYARFIEINNQSQSMTIECFNVFAITKLDDISLYSHSESVDFYDTITNERALVVYSNVYDKVDRYLVPTAFNHMYKEIVMKTDKFKDGDRLYLEVSDGYKTLHNIEEYQKHLFYGNLKNAKSKNYVSILDKMNLDVMRKDIRSYLNLWDKYNEIELQQAFVKCKETGVINYEFIDFTNNITIHFDDKNFKKLKSKFLDEMITIGSKQILLLFQANGLKAYTEIEKMLMENEEATTVSVNRENINFTEKSVTIFTKKENKDMLRKIAFNHTKGYICLSLLGNTISFKRRKNAKERIINGESGISKLYSWFGDDPVPSNRENVIDIDYSIMKNKHLTDNQLEAIKIMCNTPDIAIIQGPPGTGKTTAIREAIIQLNAVSKNKYSFGNNLLTGFKHETVNNLSEDIELFGMPALKVGEKNDTDDELTTKLEKQISDFTNNLIDKLDKKYEDITIKEDKYVDFKNKFYDYYLFYNTLESSINILNEIKQMDDFKCDYIVCSKIDSLIEELKKSNKRLTPTEDEFLNILYNLPLSKEAFSDDQIDIIINLEALEACDNSLSKDISKVKKVLDNFDPIKMKNLRRELILKYMESPNILVSNNRKREIIEYLKELLEIIKCHRLKEIGGSNIAIIDYIESLKENPALIKETLLHYTKVLGATNQQCVSKSMSKLKPDDIKFDNVFVDEAATSNPLDLFIPMSIAKNRIILVGDHKQLPHIVNEDIIELMKIDDKKKEDMESTLFENIMESAKILQRKDGIKRVITLNTQFRMHPLLGEIVSDTFYDGEIKSIRPASEFDHNYHNMNGKYLHWINVPYDSNEKYRIKNSHSRVNYPEANKIACHIKDALNAGTKLSIGVITLYRDQVGIIKEKLAEYGIDVENNNILVGTVDAFQGREFDVVYLSIAYVFSEKESRRYSRLAMKDAESLLCVALSRQKDLLIIVGDLDIFTIQGAKEEVPSLYKIAIKCKEAGFYE